MIITRVPETKFRVGAFITILCCIAGVSNAYAVTIDTAKWNLNRERLVLKGQDSPQSVVALFDAASGLPLATVRTKASGAWAKTIDAVSNVPCRVRATSSSGQAEAVVARAPADCAAPVLVMDTVKWKVSAGTLLAFGYADTLNTVFLTDALTGAELGSIKAGDDGRWRTEISALTEIPCRVQASTQGTRVDAGVRQAPADCSSSPLSPELAATIFADKQCNLCHGNDGSGNPGPDVSGEPASEIIRALAKEEVHAGITATSEEAEALAAFLSDPSPLPLQEMVSFSDPETCRTCHPRQYKEWSGNMMAYSAVSPTFNALESLGNRFSQAATPPRPGFAAGDHGTALFCQSCHNPVDTFLGNFPSLEDSNDQPMRDFATPVGLRGISCDVCHQISMPDDDDQGLGHLGDGVANVAYVLEPGATKYGPLDNPNPNPVHESAHAKDINMQDGYLDSAEFCASCHDVRTPPDSALADAVDPVTGEPFQRLENLFTEWKNGPFGPINNQVGGVVTCQDCHMDLGPPAPAGSYEEGETTVYPRPRDVQEREKVSTHYFTGVDIALVDFPGQDDEARDENGNLIGQVQRRRQLLESAATISVSAPNEVAPDSVASVFVDVTNVGSGHNIPSGFSQERQLWVELIVSDANGVLYESGTLVDTAHPETGEMQPDGNLDDEDLRNLVGPDGVSGGVIDPVTLEANVIHGPDYNQRHHHPPIYKGLANFGNEFIRIPVDDDGNPKVDADGHFVEEEVFMPFLSTHTDNSFSIPPLETERIRYDVDIPADAAGPVTVSARLRFRAFPPRFLRALAQGRPDLVNEKMVDRNRIVEMTSANPVAMQVVP